MTLVRHEWRQGRGALLAWTGIIGLLLVICVGLYPEMRSEMEDVSALFSSMGAFSAAFGMDRIGFGTFTGYYGVECGNVLGLGGALYAALTGIGALAGEERGHTAELLLTHPVRRRRIVSEKLAGVLLRLFTLNAVTLVLCAGAIGAIGEPIPWRELMLLHLAYFLLQVELAALCFGLSAFLRRGGAGLGLGIAAGMYFLNLMANLSEKAGFLRYVTPFAYAEGADILAEGTLDGKRVLPGMLYAALGIAAAYVQYDRKDIY